MDIWTWLEENRGSLTDLEFCQWKWASKVRKEACVVANDSLKGTENKEANYLAVRGVDMIS